MRTKSPRNKSGAVLPLVMVATLLLVAFLGFAVDLSRNMLTVQQLQFAAESAATDAFANVINQDRQYPGDRGLANCQARIATTSGSTPWNMAPVGPQTINGNWVSGVSIDPTDVAYVSNPNDATEPVLQVTARRSGAEALRKFFLASSSSPYKTVEVIASPATRIGKGVSHFASTSSPFAGWAALPLVISDKQFESLSASGSPDVEYRIQLLDSTTPYQSNPQIIRGAFANVARAAGGTSSPYYGPVGAGGMNDLVGNWYYFSVSADAREVPPAVVERNSSLLPVFDCGAGYFTADKTRVIQAIQTVSTNKLYVVPVVKNDPTPNASLEVVGFALLNITRLYNSATGDFDIRCKLSESLPVRNATTSAIKAVPAVLGTSLPAPAGVFANRSYDTAARAFAPRPLGVCMAPAISPRSL